MSMMIMFSNKSCGAFRISHILNLSNSFNFDFGKWEFLTYILNIHGTPAIKIKRAIYNIRLPIC